VPFELVDMREEHREPLKRFLEENWRPGYILNEPEFFEWQFRRNPFRPEGLYSTNLLGFVEGRLVSHLGYIPVPISNLGEVTLGCWLTTWITARQARGQRVGFWVWVELLRRYPFTLTLGVGPQVQMEADSTRGGKQKQISRGGEGRTLARRRRLAGWSGLSMNFAYLPALPRWVAVLEPQGAAALLEDPAGRRRECELLAAPATGAGKGVVEVERFGEETSAWWQGRFARGTIGTARTHTYLNWRYADHPRFRYRHLLRHSDAKELDGLAVLRIEPVRGRPEKVARLVEWLPASPQAGEALAAAVNELARAEGACLIDWFCMRSAEAAGLEAVGFHREGSPGEPRFPRLFQPLAREPEKLNAWLRCPPEPFEAAGLPPESCPWYVTQSDGDQDRPN
jgi:hypothetical protein